MTTFAHAADKMPVPFKQTGNTPIDITADQLEVLQAENKAIFTGHVVAIQGDVRLNAEKMTVYYRQQEDKNKIVESRNSIRRIEVEQNVFLATAMETASGASGVYDVENHQITLHNNVVLTKDKNTIKGDQLVYDFNTGKSKITSGGTQTAPGGRVRALFIPENNDKK